MPRSPPRSATSAATTWTRCSQAYAADRRHPPDGDHRLHDQGLWPADPGSPAESLVAADRGAVQRTRRLTGQGSDATVEPLRCRKRCRAICARDAERVCTATRCPMPLPPAIPDESAAPRRPSRPRRRAGPGAAGSDPGSARRPPSAWSPSAPTSVRPPIWRGWVNKVGVWSPTERPQLVRRRCRDHHALARAAHRPAHRAGHRRDQPGRADRGVRCHLEPMGSTAAADRCAL